MSIKIASLNVHGLSARGEAAKLAKLIYDTSVDICCFQEATRKGINIVVERLDQLSEQRGAWSCQCHLGIAVVTRFEIKMWDTLNLGRYKKAALKVQLWIGKEEPDSSSPDQHNFEFVTTHLDHIYEELRVSQVEKLVKFAISANVIAGDLNALREADYSKQRWKDIAKARKCAGLTPASSDAMNALEKCGWKPSDYVGPTTPYGTRVDYILVQGDHIVDPKVLVTLDNLPRHESSNVVVPLTDHNYVMATILREVDKAADVRIN